MDISWNRISRSPVILLLAGLSAGVVLTTLMLAGQAFTKKADPIFDALSGRRSGPLALSTPAKFGMPSSPSSAADMPSVASLSELLPRLEAKVAAQPRDPDLQILLARTYLELDQKKKGEELLDKLNRQFPQNEHLPFLRAKMLMGSDAAADLRKAISLFEESTRRRPAVAYLARLYQGQILVRLGERKQAIKVWRDFVGTLPPGDARRRLLEAELEKTTSSQDIGSSS